MTSSWLEEPKSKGLLMLKCIDKRWRDNKNSETTRELFKRKGELDKSEIMNYQFSKDLQKNR